MKLTHYPPFERFARAIGFVVVKSMWIATGVIIGLGVAGLVAANSGPAESQRTIGAGDADTAASELTSVSATSTTTTVYDSISTSDEAEPASTTIAIHQIANVATTTSASVSTTPDVSSTTTPTTVPSWHWEGDTCSVVGAAGFNAVNQPLVCVAGIPNTWQRVYP